MAEYLLVNIIVLAVVVAVLVTRGSLVFDTASKLTLVVLLITTAIFDSLIIASGIVAYDESKLLGLYIWQAPVEDFFYSLAAVIIVPSVWQLTVRRTHE